MRANLWEQTDIALQFFEQYLPYWDMQPCENVSAYCLEKPGEVYATYLIDPASEDLVLNLTPGQYQVEWYDPLNGGDLQIGKQIDVKTASSVSVGPPPVSRKDWVVLARRQT